MARHLIKIIFNLFLSGDDGMLVPSQLEVQQGLELDARREKKTGSFHKRIQYYIILYSVRIQYSIP